MFINDLFGWFFLQELDIICNFFSLAYPCFSCCVWTAMIVLRTRADDITGVRGFEELYGVDFETYIVNICISICPNHVLGMFWKTLILYRTM